MKKFLFFILFLFYHSVFCQDNLIASENLPELILTKRKANTENEKPPVFPLGSEIFRKILSENFRTEKISDSLDIHCDLFFIVDKEGNISEIKANGTNQEFNNEAVYALSKIKEKWEPATLNGIPVKYMMKVPLDMKFNEKARFPTGEDSFKKKIMENLQMKNIQGKKSCTISFVVEMTGRISKTKAEGTDKKFNKNVERSISKIKERWIPMFLRGFPIASEIKINFEIN